MTTQFEKLVSAILSLAAVAIASTLIHREFFAKTPPGSLRRHSEYVDSWHSMLDSARFLGERNAPITVIEFTDFECPFCRRFHKALTTARAKYPSQLAVAIVHFPLPGHDHARPAARAAECAAAQGRFTQAVDILFESQDSLGHKTWTSFAKQFGVADTVAFGECMADSTSDRMIRAGLALGQSDDVNATPTVLLNGWRFGMTPTDTEFVRAIGDIIAGRKPYKGFPARALPQGTH